HVHRVVFVGNRLPARLEIDHAQPAHAERHVAVDVGAFVIGTAMSQRGRHSPEDLAAPRARSIDEEPGYPAHDPQNIRAIRDRQRSPGSRWATTRTPRGGGRAGRALSARRKTTRSFFSSGVSRMPSTRLKNSTVSSRVKSRPS